MDGLAQDLSTVLDLGKATPIAITAVTSKKHQRHARRKKRAGACGNSEKAIIDSESHIGSASSSGDDGGAAARPAVATPSGSYPPSFTSISALSILQNLPKERHAALMLSSHPSASASHTNHSTSVTANVIESDSFNENFGPVVALCRDKNKRMAVDTTSVNAHTGRHVNRRKKRRVRDKSACMDVTCDGGVVLGTPDSLLSCKHFTASTTTTAVAVCMSSPVMTSCRVDAASGSSTGVPSTSTLTIAALLTHMNGAAGASTSVAHPMPAPPHGIDWCEECRKRSNSAPSQCGATVAAAGPAGRGSITVASATGNPVGAGGGGKRKRAKKRRSHCHHSNNPLAVAGGGCHCGACAVSNGPGSGNASTHRSTATSGLHNMQGEADCTIGGSYISGQGAEYSMDMDISTYDSADTSSVSDYDETDVAAAADPGADTTDEARDGDDEGSDEHEVGETYGIPMIPWWKLSINHSLQFATSSGGKSPAAAAAAGPVAASSDTTHSNTNYCLGIPTITREILAGKRRLKSRAKPHFHQLNEKIKRFLNDAAKQDLCLESTRKEERDHVRLLARLYCIGIRYEGSLKNTCILTKTRSTKLNVKEILQ